MTDKGPSRIPQELEQAEGVPELVSCEGNVGLIARRVPVSLQSLTFFVNLGTAGTAHA